MTSSWSLSDLLPTKGGTGWVIRGTQPGAEGESWCQDVLGSRVLVPNNGDCGSSPTVRSLGYWNSCGTIGSLGTVEECPWYVVRTDSCEGAKCSLDGSFVSPN